MLFVLFICTGNTCRSVMAAALMRSCVGSDFEIASAGLAVNPGDRASAQVRTLLAEEGIDVSSHTAVSLDAALVERADLILVMTGRHLSVLLEQFPQAAAKTDLLKDYAGTAGLCSDIADPFCGSLEKYRQTLEEIRDSITKSIAKLNGGEFDAGGSGK